MGILSQNLRNDHKDILLTLNVLEKMCNLAQAGAEVDLVDVTRIIYFIKIFADECHHGKEERILFPAFEKVALKNQKVLIKELSSEHQKQRKLIGMMQDAILRDSVEINSFVQSSLSYLILLRDHIEKENSVLLPACDIRLSDKKQMDLAKKFEIFENQIIGKGYYPLFHSMLENFELKYLIRIPENSNMDFYV